MCYVPPTTVASLLLVPFHILLGIGFLGHLYALFIDYPLNCSAFKSSLLHSIFYIVHSRQR